MSASLLPRQWHFLHSPAADGSRNMAVDAALLARVQPGGAGVLRCYAWSRPTVSFGRNETTIGRFDEESMRAAGLEAVRRPTGGRALLHAREVTYSAAFPLPEGAPWRAAYDAVNAVVLDALHALGVGSARLAPAEAGRGVRPDGPTCFDRPADGEIVVGGAKLVGSAVWRERGRFLQHGSILVHDDQRRLQDAARVPLPPPQPAATLSTLLPAGRADDAAVAAALAAALRDTLARVGDVTPIEPDPSMEAEIARLDETFRQPGWLWRR